MNKERMLQLADYIENLPEHKFEMQYWISNKIEQGTFNNKPYWSIESYPLWHSNPETLVEPLNCGTACCIAGWAAAIENNFKPISLLQDGKSIEDRAAIWLDLNQQEAHNLFLIGLDSVWVDYIAKTDIELDNYEETFTSITNKTAALVIRDIANGVIDIDREYDSDESREYLEELGYFEDDEF
jgi:hypothetical protein